MEITSTSTHPRDTYDYLHNDAAERAFLDAFGRGRLHHAWLLCGPQGLGKATFAYRAARFLMGNDRDPSLGLLGISSQDADARLIAAQSHPDMLALEREANRSQTTHAPRSSAGRMTFSRWSAREAYIISASDTGDQRVASPLTSRSRKASAPGDPPGSRV